MTVEQIISKVFSTKLKELNDLSARETIEGWDSMGHLTLITEIEEQFKVNISIADALQMISVREIKTILRSYGANL